MESIEVVIVDSDLDFCDQAVAFLGANEGWSASKAASTEEAAGMIIQGIVDAVISGHRPPDLDAIRLLRTTRERSPSTAFILFTCKGEEQTIAQALNEGADGCLLRDGDPAAHLQDLGTMVGNSVAKRRAEKRIVEYERQYRLLAENASDVIWRLDLDSRRFTYVSPGIKRLRGISSQEAISEPLELAVDPESLARIRAEMPSRIRRFLKGEEGMRTVVYVVKQPRSDGTWVAVEASTTLVEDARNEVHELLGIARDLTQRIQQEQQLKESQRKLMTLMSNLRGVAYRRRDDMSCTMEFVSEGCLDLTGYQS